MAADIRASDPDRAGSARAGGGRSNLGRSAFWGIIAAAALAGVITLAQTPTGSLRLQSAMAAIGAPDAPGPVQTAARRPTAEAEIKALQAKLDRLTAERDKIEARLAALEHGFEDVTGSVRRVQAATDGLADHVTAPEMNALPKIAAQPTPAVPLIDPLAIPPAGSVPKLPESTIVKRPAPAAVIATQAAPTPAPAGPAVPKAAAPARAEESLTVPLPPQRVAAAGPPPPAAARHEYGVALAAAGDVDALRVRWTMVKANFGPLLVGLTPLAMRDSQHGGVRLVAGPLSSLAAARDLCGRFTRLNGDCAPVRVDPAAIVQR